MSQVAPPGRRCGTHHLIRTSSRWVAPSARKRAQGNGSWLSSEGAPPPLDKRVQKYRLCLWRKPLQRATGGGGPTSVGPTISPRSLHNPKNFKKIKIKHKKINAQILPRFPPKVRGFARREHRSSLLFLFAGGGGGGGDDDRRLRPRTEEVS